MTELFRKLAYLEGISLLILLGIAMPLKYVLELPAAVKVVGWIHGVFFIGYVILLAMVWVERRWSVKRAAAALLASVLPFGTFVFDRSLAREIGSNCQAHGE